MVVIAIALQHRLLEAARRELGPSGEVIIGTVAQRALGVPFEQVTYGQLDDLLAAVEREALWDAGKAAALELAEDLHRLRIHADADLGARLVDIVAKQLGPAAAPCLTAVCTKLGLVLKDIERTQLPHLAAAVKQEAIGLLGAETAAALAGAIEDARRLRPPGLALLMIDMAVEHLGPDGERILREICHERLEVDLDDVDIDGISSLERAVARDSVERIGAVLAAAFLAAARQAVIGPGTALRTEIMKLANRHLGPAGPLLLKRLAGTNGLPFEVVSYEHLLWLADVVRAETTPLLGAHSADELARGVAALLPDPAVLTGGADPAKKMAAENGERRLRRSLRAAARMWLHA